MDEQEQGWRKGPWTPEEDELLSQYVKVHGEGRWSSVATGSGLKRIGKSCRLRWVNYLRPGLKRGHLTPQEEAIIIELHALWGNKWSTIARYLPGRTDNEIKNYWRTHFKKMKPPKRKAQIDSKPTSEPLKEEEKEMVRACGRDDDESLVFTDPSSMADQCYFSMAEESLCCGLWEASESEAVAAESHMNHWDNVQARSLCFGGDSNIFYNNGEFIF